MKYVRSLHDSIIGCIHGAIVAATDHRDSRLVYTLQATGRRDDRSDSRGDDRPVYTAY